MTPAQAYGHPKFQTDVATQGPTDEGLRTADCIQQQRLPAGPGCAGCGGTIPMWAQRSLSPVRGVSAGAVADRLSLGGAGALGFSLGGPSDPEIWSKISSAQQMWVSNTLNKLNNLIVSSTGTHCPTWGPAINLAGGCFQVWFNAQNMGLTKPDGSKVVLRTDGVFDQDTLDALRTVAALQPQNFKDPYPGTSLPGQTGTGEKKLSTGAMIGIGVAGAAALGGVAYLATHKKGRGRRRR